MKRKTARKKSVASGTKSGTEKVVYYEVNMLLIQGYKNDNYKKK